MENSKQQEILCIVEKNSLVLKHMFFGSIKFKLAANVCLDFLCKSNRFAAYIWKLEKLWIRSEKKSTVRFHDQMEHTFRQKPDYMHVHFEHIQKNISKCYGM